MSFLFSFLTPGLWCQGNKSPWYNEARTTYVKLWCGRTLGLSFPTTPILSMRGNVLSDALCLLRHPNWDSVPGAKTNCPYSPLFQFLNHRNICQERKFVLYHKLEEYLVLTIDKKWVVAVKVTKGDSWWVFQIKIWKCYWTNGCKSEKWREKNDASLASALHRLMTPFAEIKEVAAVQMKSAIRQVWSLLLNFKLFESRKEFYLFLPDHKIL